MDIKKTTAFTHKIWEEAILPSLKEYIQIPNKSPSFDPKWQENGHMERAVQLVADWCRQQQLKGMQLKVQRSPGRTPLIFMEVPGQIDNTILLYGHLDKQPEMAGWREELGPWKPVLQGDRLYGRGAADDGYAAFAAITALKALQEQNIPHARCLILIEASEESGSPDLPYYVEELSKEIGTPSLVICLDSGCGNYEQLWCTTSLRGIAAGTLRIKILKEGVHSGAASGIVPSTFRILRQLLSRLEDENTGKILLEALQVEIPTERLAEAKNVAATLGNQVWQDLPFIAGAQPMAPDQLELVLNRTWRPTLSVTGIGAIPSLENAGNVLRPETHVKLSLRLPPTCNAAAAAAAIKMTLEKNPPYGAAVSFTGAGEPGWNAPPMQAWLKEAVNQASENYFGKPSLYWGEGGTIPFMGMLGEKFPQAQFVITGVLGPQSNAHGPNEFLHIPTAKKLTGAIAEIIAKHFEFWTAPRL